MHRVRHSFATDLRRAADVGAASEVLGQSATGPTAAVCGHNDLSDLERAVDALALLAETRRADRLSKRSIDRHGERLG